MANPNLRPEDADVLSVMASRQGASLFMKVSVYIFSFGVIGLGIPLFSVVVRYNLFVGKVFSSRWSSFFGVVFPWLVSFLLYQGDGFDLFVTWASLLINGAINFILPVVLYITARSRHRLRQKLRAAKDSDPLTTTTDLDDSDAELTGPLYERKDLYFIAISIIILTSVLLLVAIVLQIQSQLSSADSAPFNCTLIHA